MLEVDPDIAAVVAMVPIGTIDAQTLPLARSTVLSPPVPLSDAVQRKDYVVPGQPDVVIRVHPPVGVDGLLPCVYSIHGGGFVLGSYEMDDARFRLMVPEVPVRWCVRGIPTCS